jgi:hypothetical protein
MPAGWRGEALAAMDAQGSRRWKIGETELLLDAWLK